MVDLRRDLAEFYVVVRAGQDRHPMHLETADGTQLDAWCSKRELREVAVALVAAWVVELTQLTPKTLPLHAALEVTSPRVCRDLDRLIAEAKKLATGCSGQNLGNSWRHGENGQRGKGGEG
jgi:hypothetical protein